MHDRLGSSKEETIKKTKSIIPVAEPAFTDQNLGNAITAEIKRCACHLFHDMRELTVYAQSPIELEKKRTRKVKEIE